MAKKNEFKNQDQELENVNEALSSSAQWIEDHSNLLTWIITAIVVVVLGVMALNNYVIKPKAVEASNENAKAVVYFAAGDFDKALNGDGAECMGFEAIASDYHCFQAGKLAALYAGICYFQQGDYEAATKWIRKFSANDELINPAASMLLGDAYVYMEELDKAAKAFEMAAKSENELIAPMSLKKAGLVYLEKGNKKAAKNAFQTIKKYYPQSQEAQDIEKYIAIAE